VERSSGFSRLKAVQRLHAASAARPCAPYSHLNQDASASGGGFSKAAIRTMREDEAVASARSRRNEPVSKEEGKAVMWPPSRRTNRWRVCDNGRSSDHFLERVLATALAIGQHLLWVVAEGAVVWRAGLAILAMVSFPARAAGQQPPESLQTQALPTVAAFSIADRDSRFGPLQVAGVVTEVRWVSPAVQILIRDGAGKGWYVLSDAPDKVRREGVSEEMLKAGARIEARGHSIIGIPCAPLCVGMAHASDLVIDGRKPVHTGEADPSPARTQAAGAPSPPMGADGIPVFIPRGTLTSEVDPQAPVTVAGVIMQASWKNPSMEIFVRDRDGADWILKSDTPNTVLRAGGDRSIIAKGAAIFARGHRDAGKVCQPACIAFVAPNRILIEGRPLIPGLSWSVAPPPKAAGAALGPISPGSAWGLTPATLEQAIAEGNAWAVFDVGGAPKDAIAALKVRLQREPELGYIAVNRAHMQARLDELADTSGGATFRVFAPGQMKTIMRIKPGEKDVRINIYEDGGYSVR
jgi:hypothetical protein